MKVIEQALLRCSIEGRAHRVERRRRVRSPRRVRRTRPPRHCCVGGSSWRRARIARLIPFVLAVELVPIRSWATGSVRSDPAGGALVPALRAVVSRRRGTARRTRRRSRSRHDLPLVGAGNSAVALTRGNANPEGAEKPSAVLIRVVRSWVGERTCLWARWSWRLAGVRLVSRVRLLVGTR